MSALPFRILALSHIGIASDDANGLMSFFTDMLGLPLVSQESVAQQKTKTTVFCSQHGDLNPHSSARLEILEAESLESPVKKFLQKKGSGIHHIALQVDDIHKLAAYLKSKKIPTTTDSPTQGIHGSQVLFIHPKASFGILIEFVQE